MQRPKKHVLRLEKQTQLHKYTNKLLSNCFSSARLKIQPLNDKHVLSIGANTLFELI